MPVGSSLPTLLRVVLCVHVLRGSAGTPASSSREFWVGPDGRSTNDGSRSSPWDWNSTCGQNPPHHTPAAVQPGDTVWVLGGSYGRNGSYSNDCHLTGTAAAPIIVRAVPGDRVTLWGSLGVFGNYTWYWGFEVANSYSRLTHVCTSNPDGPNDGIHFYEADFYKATGNKLINNVVHDCADGIGDQQALETEDYGNIVYNNGWVSTCDRNHGHGMYLQNNGSVVKLFAENIGFNNFCEGIQAYGERAVVSNMHFVGNTFFNNGVSGGALSIKGRAANLIIASGCEPKENFVIEHHVAYNPTDAPTNNTGYNELSPWKDDSKDIAIRSSWWVGAPKTSYWTLAVNGWASLELTNNTIVGPLVTTKVKAYNISNNQYFGGAHPPPGHDGGSAVSPSLPSGVQVLVRPNKYELGRAHIVVFNWERTAQVSVDLAGTGLKTGQQYEVRDVQNFWGAAVLKSTFSDPQTGNVVSLPMRLTEVLTPINWTFTPPHTSAEFAVFVVLPVPKGRPGNY